MHLTSIEIRNFKGISRLSLNKFSQVNIFVGRNNSGKSRCLEAISLLASGSNGFKDAFDIDVLISIAFRDGFDEPVWDYVITEGVRIALIEGVSHNRKKSSHIAQVLISKDFESAVGSSEEVEHFEKKLLREELLIREKYGYSPKKLIKAKEKRIFFTYQPFVANPYITEIFRTSDMNEVIGITDEDEYSNKNFLFLRGSSYENYDLHDKAARSGTIIKVISRLHKKNPEIIDLRPIDNQLFIFYTKDRKYPLSIMGDGFKASILVSLSAQILKNGILVLEEPENFLHPGLLMHLVDELILACKERNVQLFISTHSEDLLKFFLERSGKISLSIIKMNRGRNKISAETIEKAKSIEQINKLGIDLRGF